MKYHQLGEGAVPALGQTVELQMMLRSTAGDTMHYVPNYPYFVDLKGSFFDRAICELTEGDSVRLRIPRKRINEQFKFYKVMEADSGKVDVDLRVVRAYSKEQARKRKQKALSKREVNEQAALIKYLNEKGSDLEELMGVYRKVGGKVLGDSIRYGSEVSIHYKGSFLNGYVFDNTYLKGITPTFTYGEEYQMIEGMQIGLSGLHEGESVKIILPSRRAFGEEGSLAGIVPPYTAVIFDVQIINVKN